MFDFSTLLRPKSVAVIGVSLSNAMHPANVIYNKLDLRYPVRVFPVNPKGGELRNRRVYADVSEIPEPVDMAVIAARAEHVPDILESCIRHKAGGATVISGGFAERGRFRSGWLPLPAKRIFPLSGPTAWGSTSPAWWTLSFCPENAWFAPSRATSPW